MVYRAAHRSTKKRTKSKKLGLKSQMEAVNWVNISMVVPLDAGKARVGKINGNSQF